MASSLVRAQEETEEDCFCRRRSEGRDRERWLRQACALGVELAKEIYCLARVFMAYPRFVQYIFTTGPAWNARAHRIIVSGSANSASLLTRADCRALEKKNVNYSSH